MAELGLVAAVVQLADVGVRIGDKIYTFGQTVASADDSIVFISKHIAHTSSILKTLADRLDKDHEEYLYSPNDVNTADTIVKECLEIAQEMDRALSKKMIRMGLDGGSSRSAIIALERLKWPFLKPRMMLLWSHLDKLTSSLQFLLNVFIYARSLVERTEESSVVNDQRITIEDLLRTNAEQSRKYESLKAVIDSNKSFDAARSSDNGYEPATPDLNATMIPIETPAMKRSDAESEAPEADPETALLDNYCLLIRRLIGEVEDEGYRIGRDMRCRIKDSVVHVHKRETQLLRAIYGHTELKGKMSESSWRLAEIAGEEAKDVEWLPSSSGPMFGRSDESGRPHPDANRSQSSQDNGNQKRLGDFKQSSDNVNITTMARARASTFYPPLSLLLNSREDPWTPQNFVSQVPKVEEPRALGDKGWVPFWVSGASRPRLRNILPSNPLKSHTQDLHLPALPSLRSGTSMLVTEKSHDVESVASSQDLAALTDSTSTETFVSADSDVDELALDSRPLSVIDSDKPEPLVALNDPEYTRPLEKDPQRPVMTNLDLSLSELAVA